MILKKGAWALPEDDSLVSWAAAQTELGYGTVRMIYKLVRQGRLRRHPSRRGVTRESMQSFVGGTKMGRASDYFGKAAAQVADAVAAKLELDVVARDDVAYEVMRVLAATLVRTTSVHFGSYTDLDEG